MNPDVAVRVKVISDVYLPDFTQVWVSLKDEISNN